MKLKRIKVDLVNPITRGGFDQRPPAGGGGTKCPDSVKSITGWKVLCKKSKFGIYFMCLMASLGMFRKSQNVAARNNDLKGGPNKP